MYDDLAVYRSRGNTADVSVGETGDDVRYQNPDPDTPSCRIRSVVIDNADNYSDIVQTDINIDWTIPDNIPYVNDGAAADIDTTASVTELYANWAVSGDINSGIPDTGILLVLLKVTVI